MATPVLATRAAGTSDPVPPTAATPRSGGSRRGGRTARRWAWRLVVLALSLGGWQLLVVSGTVSPAALASPTSIAGALTDLAGTAEFRSSISDTVRTWAIGLAVSLALAVPLGLLLGSSPLAYRLSRFTIDFLRTIPPVALIPLALLLYGATVQMALLLVVFGSVWPVLLQTMYGVHDIDPVARDVVRSYSWRRRDVVTRLVLPSAAPYIATGVRLAATMSLLLAIGAELIGGAPGLGSTINVQAEGGNVPEVYACIVAAAVLGVLVNLAVRALERRALSWHSTYR